MGWQSLMRPKEAVESAWPTITEGGGSLSPQQRWQSPRPPTTQTPAPEARRPPETAVISVLRSRSSISNLLTLRISPLLMMHLPLCNWTASTKPTGTVCTTNASTMVGPEGQQYKDEGQLLRNGPALYRGGVAAGEGDMGPDPMYQTQGHFVESSSSPSASNAASFHHRSNLFP